MNNATATIIRARTTVRVVCAAAVIVAVASMSATSAQADTGYRYWSYWNGADGIWAYATEGSGTHTPSDGDVEGWRFGIAGDESFTQPASPPDFDSICAQQRDVEGTKRIAVVIDPGSQSEAPAGEEPGSIRTECVVTNAKATGYQVLAQVADVRTDAGFVCGLDGYPASECAPLVDIPEVAQADSSIAQVADEAVESESATTAGVESTSTRDPGTPLLTAAAVSLIALIGFGIWRRRRHTESV